MTGGEAQKVRIVQHENTNTGPCLMWVEMPERHKTSTTGSCNRIHVLFLHLSIGGGHFQITISQREKALDQRMTFLLRLLARAKNHRRFTGHSKKYLESPWQSSIPPQMTVHNTCLHLACWACSSCCSSSALRTRSCSPSFLGVDWVGGFGGRPCTMRGICSKHLISHRGAYISTDRQGGICVGRLSNPHRRPHKDIHAQAHTTKTTHSHSHSHPHSIYIHAHAHTNTNTHTQKPHTHKLQHSTHANEMKK